MRTASSSVNSWRSRTQCASRCVWIEQSEIWLTCAPESENAMTVRGCFITRLTPSASNGAFGLHEELLEVGLEREVDHQLDRVDAACARPARRRWGSAARPRRAPACGRSRACGPRRRWRGRRGRCAPAYTKPGAHVGIAQRVALLVERERADLLPLGQRVERQLRSGTTTSCRCRGSASGRTCAHRPPRWRRSARASACSTGRADRERHAASRRRGRCSRASRSARSLVVGLDPRRAGRCRRPSSPITPTRSRTSSHDASREATGRSSDVSW